MAGVFARTAALRYVSPPPLTAAAAAARFVVVVDCSAPLATRALGPRLTPARPSSPRGLRSITLGWRRSMMYVTAATGGEEAVSALAEAMDEGRNRPRVSVLCVPERETLAITLVVSGRQFNLNREKHEPVGKCLARLRQNMLKAAGVGKKQKRTKGATVAAVAKDLEVALLDDEPACGALIAEETPNEEAWERGAVLRIGAELWDVDHNLPTVEEISLSPRPIANTPVRPYVSLLFAEVGDCQWRWWRRQSGETGKGENGTVVDDGWVQLECDSHFYTPTQEDVGWILRVDCLPTRRAQSAVAVVMGNLVSAESGVVEAGPSLGPGHHRHPLTPTPLASPAFRVVTYNILADQYVKFEKQKALKPDSKRKEMFWYCPTEFLDQEYRKQLVAAEVAGFHADIICLQEVDRSAFESYYCPYFADLGFEAVFSKKAGSVEEGCALLVRSSRFQIAARKDIAMKDIFTSPIEGPAAVFQPMLDASPALQFALGKVGTIGQIALLQPTAENPSAEEGPLVVANTHLFFHPAAGHIRTMHAATIALEAAAFAESAAADSGGKPAVIFCGDFNSDLNDAEGVCGAVQLLAEGRLSEGHWEWAARAGFDWHKTGRFIADEAGTMDQGDEEESMEADESTFEQGFGDEATVGVSGVELQLPFAFGSADGLSSDFTNFVSGYEASLDYCWYQRDRLVAEAFLPLPSREEVEGWCPSARWPSDHLAVVADLRYRGPEEVAAQNLSVVPSLEGRQYTLPADLCNLTKAVAPLMQDGLLAVPTDTSYGLVCCANNAAAISKLRAIDGRSAAVPLTICVGRPEDVGRYAQTSDLPEGLLQELLPGAATLILRCLPDAPLSSALCLDNSTVQLRIPEAPFLQSLAARCDRALALALVKSSGGSADATKDDAAAIWSRCNVVFDGGATTSSVPSGFGTTIDLSQAGKFSVSGEGGSHYSTLLSEKFGLQELIG